MTASVLTYLMGLSNSMFPCLFEILLSTTVIIAFGFMLERLFHRRGAVIRSFILQMTLAATLAASGIALFHSHGDSMVFVIKSPSGYFEKMLTGRTAQSKSDDYGIGRLSNRQRAATNGVTSYAPSLPQSQNTIEPSLRQNHASRVDRDKAFRFDIGYDGIVYAALYILVPLLWLVMSLLFFIRFLTGWLYVLYLRFHSVPAEKHLLSICKDIAGAIHITAPLVLRSKKVNRTLLFGVFRPFILLPIWNFTNTMATREVFLHELAHLKRRDTIWNIVSQVSKIAIPLQPLLGMLIGRITDLSDYVCDDFVVRHIPDRTTYARQLIEMADSISNSRYLAANGLGIAERKSQLRKRIERIMSRTHVPVISVSFIHAAPILLLLAFPTVVTGFIDVAGESGGQDNSFPGNPDVHIIQLYEIVDSGAIQNDTDIPDKKTGGDVETVKNDRTATVPREITGESVVPSIQVEKESVESPSRPEQETVTAANDAVPKTESPRAAGNEETITDDINNTPLEAAADTDNEPVLTKNESDTGSSNTFDTPAKTTEHHVETSETAGDSVRVAAGIYFPMERSYAGTTVPAGTDFEPDAFLGREKIAVEIPQYDSLPILQQLFYFDAERAQEYPVWSPDGKTIAFAGRAGMGIWIVPAEGGTARLVYQNYHEFEVDGKGYASYGSMYPLAFSAEGKEIFYHDWSLYADGYVKLGGNSSTTINPKIMAVNIETGVTRTLVEKTGLGCFTSDRRICVYRKMGDTYNSWKGLYARNIETGDEWKVAPYGDFGCFTADDSEVIYSVMTNGVSDLYRVPLFGGESVRLTSFTDKDICWRPYYPQCTPDGTSVVFIAQYNDWQDTSGWYANEDGSKRNVDYYGLCAMNLETGEVTRLSPDTTFLMRDLPRISPDCSKILLGASQLDEESSLGLLSELQVYRFGAFGNGKVSSADDETPETFGFAGNFPNPFNMTTMLKYSLPANGTVSLVVFNSLGQKIRTLVSGAQEAGRHTAVWNGLSDDGNPVSSGAYIARLKMKGRVTTQRMTLVK